jgi:hypothetical protein
LQKTLRRQDGSNTHNSNAIWPIVFHLFISIKKYLEGKRFAANADVKEAVSFWLYNGKLRLLGRKAALVP